MAGASRARPPARASGGGPSAHLTGFSPPLAAARRPAAGAKARGGGGGAGRRSAWLAEDGSKRWGEAFFLLYTPFWLTLCLGIIVPFKLYEVLLVDLRRHAWFGYRFMLHRSGPRSDLLDLGRVLGVEWVSG